MDLMVITVRTVIVVRKMGPFLAKLSCFEKSSTLRLGSFEQHHLLKLLVKTVVAPLHGCHATPTKSSSEELHSLRASGTFKFKQLVLQEKEDLHGMQTQVCSNPKY